MFLTELRPLFAKPKDAHNDATAKAYKRAYAVESEE